MRQKLFESVFVHTLFDNTAQLHDVASNQELLVKTKLTRRQPLFHHDIICHYLF